MPPAAHLACAAVIACAAAACLASPGTACGDGTVCADGTICVERHRQCVRPAQLETCRGRAAGPDCLVGAIVGVCRDETCLLPTCGDGVRNQSEVCDGADLGAVTCASFGYHAGVLLCGDSCELDLR